MKNFIFFIYTGMALTFMVHAAHAADFTNDEVITQTLETMNSLDIQNASIIIADGRSKGGEKGMIISYSQNRHHDHVENVINVFKSGYMVNKNVMAELDGIVIVVKDLKGKYLGMVSAKITSIDHFVTKGSLDGQIKEWKIRQLSKNFMEQDGLLLASMN